MVRQGEILNTISQPNIPAMEAIGGTGDTITGIVAALIYGGYEVIQASVIAAKTNRIAGKLCNPTPATQIGELVAHIPHALAQVLGKEGGLGHA